LSAPPDRLDLSMNEVETLGCKAARGTGLPWGVAEDTGRAAGWIARRAGPWAGQLLALLEVPPPPEASPLLLAGLLADSFTPREIERVVAPLWALPGLLAAAPRTVSIRLDDAEIRCNPGEHPSASVPAEALALLAEATLSVRFPPAPLPRLAHALPMQFRRSLVAAADWRRLEALASRTYVPASDHSRRTGAGAGLLDDE
jgi:hypothetical protein